MNMLEATDDFNRLQAACLRDREAQHTPSLWREAEHRIEIVTVDGGWMIRPSEDGPPMVLEQQEGESDARAAQRLLWMLIDVLGLGGSDFDREQVAVMLRPGDEWEPTPSEQDVPA
jgi:hypothetical protein